MRALTGGRTDFLPTLSALTQSHLSHLFSIQQAVDGEVNHRAGSEERIPRCAEPCGGRPGCGQSTAKTSRTAGDLVVPVDVDGGCAKLRPDEGEGLAGRKPGGLIGDPDGPAIVRDLQEAFRFGLLIIRGD